MVKIVNECNVEYVDHMGSDLSVVNAARVSFDKESKWVVGDGTKECDPMCLHFLDCACGPQLSSKDTKLIQYLANHNHWSPFAHTSVSFRIKAPIFVARQLGKHQVGLVWNEVSRRYVESEPEFFVPEMWRKRAENVKQGSSQEAVEILRDCHKDWKDMSASDVATSYFESALSLYESLLISKVCPEQARMILPQSMMTEWIWTGSLMAWSRVTHLRLDPHTQKETRDVVQKISDVIAPLFPDSWAALTKDAGTDYRGEVHRLRKLLQENGIDF